MAAKKKVVKKRVVKKKAEEKPKSEWKKKLVHKWGWLGAVVGFFVGAPFWAAAALWLWESDVSGAAAAILIDNWAREAVLLAVMALLLGRLIAVARWPREPALDYNKITFPGVLAANSLTIILGVALLICTLALVAPRCPGVGSRAPLGESKWVTGY